ncbi:protein of unknown function [Pseudorhizobium banfieldiae]|uniref:Uncharacterized protein n=1 Tax=Pseudorhizobium banfieldiae TaxID=1125847 RepID=L0NBW9_9HYPH|nr:protein of unknown function [Pseudorhizobium banfieldiae]
MPMTATSVGANDGATGGRYDRRIKTVKHFAVGARCAGGFLWNGAYQWAKVAVIFRGGG